MKVTSDGILGIAIELKNKRNIQDESSKGSKEKIKSDSIEIRSRLAQRLTTIQGELNNLQSTLTKNQIIKAGINQLTDDFDNGKNNAKNILNQVQFENKYVLSDFLDNDVTYEKITSGNERVGKLIEKDIKQLKGFQIELENIAASNLADNSIADTISKIEHSLLNIDFSSVSKISQIKSDSVIDLLN